VPLGSRVRRATEIAVAGLLVVGLAGGCQGEVGGPGKIPSSGRSASPAIVTEAPSAQRSPAASPVRTPGASSAAIGIDRAIRTVVDNVRVRSSPGLGVSSAKLEPLLRRGTKLFVVAGPARADGYTWYRVMPFDGIAPSGWIASADRDRTPWVESVTQACPAPPLDATALLDLRPFGGLACYGGAEIQLVGDVDCDVADVDRVIGGPDWLKTDRYCVFDLDGETIELLDGGIPGLVLPTTRRAIVTGHFDDPQAASCVYALREGPKQDPAFVVVNCRAMFVATRLEAVR
jgi:hypothetical protein